MYCWGMCSHQCVGVLSLWLAVFVSCRARADGPQDSAPPSSSSCCPCKQCALTVLWVPSTQPRCTREHARACLSCCHRRCPSSLCHVCSCAVSLTCMPPCCEAQPARLDAARLCPWCGGRRAAAVSAATCIAMHRGDWGVHSHQPTAARFVVQMFCLCSCVCLTRSTSAFLFVQVGRRGLWGVMGRHAWLLDGGHWVLRVTLTRSSIHRHCMRAD